MTDEEFLRFVDGTGEPAGHVRFGHREHLRLAWLCLARDGEERGAARTIAAIQRVAAAHEASE